MKSITDFPSDRQNFQAAIEDNIGSCIIALLSLLSLISAICWPYIKINKVLSERLIDITSFNDYLIVNMFVFVSYTLQYVLTAGILEYAHPRGFKSKSLTDKQRKQRKRQIRKELTLGIAAMLSQYSTVLLIFSKNNIINLSYLF